METERNRMHGVHALRCNERASSVQVCIISMNIIFFDQMENRFLVLMSNMSHKVIKDVDVF